MSIATRYHELTDNSTYSKIFAQYTRTPSYELLSAVGKNGFDIKKYWTRVSAILEFERRKGQFSQLSEDVFEIRFTTEGLESDDYMNGGSSDVVEKKVVNLLALETELVDETGQIRGLIMADYQGLVGDHAKELKAFHRMFSRLILFDSKMSFSLQPSLFDEHKSQAFMIANFFAMYLKFSVEDEKWDSEGMHGKNLFVETVHYFTSRNLVIEAVLPAFPCKSSNLNKVHGLYPDNGEEMALRRLIEVVEMSKEVYEPGMKIYIVSDGHVFSDCIGVDDDVVDVYTRKLREMYASIIKGNPLYENGKGPIGFVSLKDLFFSSSQGVVLSEDYAHHVKLPHYTGSVICEDAELCRKLMMIGCDTDSGKLRSDIGNEDSPRLRLYRGFTKFMNEDLSLHPNLQGLTRKKFKKIVSQVAFEMIKRNDAYSNLVELIFPFHLRFSIHSHPNIGPKYGIRIIHPGSCRAIKEFGSDESPVFDDYLHIPTPWHNCVVFIKDHEKPNLVRSKLVHEVLENKTYRGGWVATRDDCSVSGGGKVLGGFYCIEKIAE